METVSVYKSFEELCSKGKEKSRATAIGKSGVKTRGNARPVWEVMKMIWLVGRRDGRSR